MISDGGFNIGLRLGIPSRHLIGFNTFWKSNGPRIWMMTGCSPILGNTQSWGNKKRIQDIMVIWGSFNHGDLFCSCFFFSGWSMLIEANTQAVFWIMGVSQWVNKYRYGMCSGDVSAFLGDISYWEGIGNHVQSQPRISRILLNQW
jgi:hypothetical protein